MQKRVVANWKMNGNIALAEELTKALKLQSFALDIELTICPPFVLLPYVYSKLKYNREFNVGAQDVSMHSSGAYTGEISASMLKEAGCRYVIIGHSERRLYHHEGDEIILKKMQQVLQAGLTPILCIGEHLEEQKSGQTQKVLDAQLSPILKHYQENFILAYEPVWAIGTGLAAAAEEIGQTHDFLRKLLYNCPTVPILYGGSVNAKNAREILKIKNVNGVLVGGASLKVDEITAICAVAHDCNLLNLE